MRTFIIVCLATGIVGNVVLDYFKGRLFYYEDGHYKLK